MKYGTMDLIKKYRQLYPLSSTMIMGIPLSVWCVMSLGVALRCFDLTAPLLDLASWRETQTAMITRNLVRDGFDLFHPRIDWFGNAVAYLALEFPLYNALVGGLYVLFGEHEIFGRLVSIAFFSGSTLFFYLLAKLLLDEKAVFFSLLFFVVSPLSIFFTQTYMPESLMLFLLIGAVYFLLQWTRTLKHWFLIFTVIFGATAFLVKTPVAIQLLPLFLYVFWQKYRCSKFRMAGIFSFLFIIYVPICLWVLYSLKITAQFFPSENISKFIGNFQAFVDLKSYLRIGGFLTLYLFAPHGLLLLAVAFISKRNNDNHRFILAWLSGVLIYLVLFFHPLVNHAYYLLPLVPIVALYIGKGSLQAIDFLKKKFSPTSYRVIAVIFAGTFAVYVLVPLHHFSVQDEIFFKAAEAVRRSTNPEDLILCATFHRRVNAFSNPAVLYYSKRNGWVDLFPYDLKKLLDTIEKHRQEGARYLVLTFDKSYKEKTLIGKLSNRGPDFEVDGIISALNYDYKQVESNSNYIIYKL